MTNRYFAVLFCALAIFSCSKETHVSESGNYKTFDSFSVSIEDTKVAISPSGELEWESEDCIGVFSDIQTTPVKFRRSAQGGVFTGAPVSGNTFYAVYPFDGSEKQPVWFDRDNPTVAKGSGLLMLAAKTTEDALFFRQIEAMLHFHFRMDGADSIQATVRGNNFEYLDGTVDLSSDEPVLTSSGAGRGTDHCQYLKAFHSEKSEDGEWNVYFPMPQMVLKDGLTLYVKGFSGEELVSSFTWTNYNSLSLSKRDMVRINANEKEDVVHTLQEASRGAGINLVLMGDGYTAAQIADGTYHDAMKSTADAFFSESPYCDFRDCFNVFYVDVASRTRTLDGNTTLGTWTGSGTTVGGDNDNVMEYARLAVKDELMDDTTIIVLLNKDVFAGTCYLSRPSGTYGNYGRGRAISYVPAYSEESSFRYLVLHEAGGHGFAKLDEEYGSSGTISSTEVETRRSLETLGWCGNVDFTSDPAKVKWSRFISDNRFGQQHIGVYEGACSYFRGAYRPSENSLMRGTGGDSFNAPSRYAIWYRIQKLAFPSHNPGYEEFAEYDVASFNPKESGKYNNPDVLLAPPVILAD